jgi:hypothetical protein
MVHAFSELETALKEVFEFYRETGRFPWKVEGFLPQNHKTNEDSLIRVV